MRSLLKLLLIVCGLFISCEKNPVIISPKFDFDWEKASPIEQGIDSVQLAKAFDEAHDRGFIYSLLVVRNGFLVGERYYHGYDKYDAFNVKSVSKSFISALVGIALREGYLKSLEQKLMDFFPEYQHDQMDARKYEITIRHLLTMRAGFDNSIEDYGNHWMFWISSPDWVGHALNLPMEYDPGAQFAYITAETHLLSAILTKSSGMTSFQFAQKYLFTPLGISIRTWEKDPQDYYIGGMDMYFTPRDMARFGYLYLNDGLIGKRQIVQRDWIHNSLYYHSGGSWTWGHMDRIGYGFQWWLGQINDHDCFMALGYGGQYILIFPGLNLVVVTTSSFNFDPETADAHERSILELVHNDLLTSIR